MEKKTLKQRIKENPGLKQAVGCKRLRHKPRKSRQD